MSGKKVLAGPGWPGFLFPGAFLPRSASETDQRINLAGSCMRAHLKSLLVAGTAALFVAGCATQPKPSKSVEQVMEEGFEGKESLCARVSSGAGSKADLATLADLTYQLTLSKPPQGDLQSWTEKTTALHAAAKALVAGQPGALDGWKAASNCKACHSVHKPAKK
jgi:hypothetical protein